MLRRCQIFFAWLFSPPRCRLFDSRRRHHESQLNNWSRAKDSNFSPVTRRTRRKIHVSACPLQTPLFANRRHAANIMPRCHADTGWPAITVPPCPPRNALLPFDDADNTAAADTP